MFYTGRWKDGGLGRYGEVGREADRESSIYMMHDGLDYGNSAIIKKT